MADPGTQTASVPDVARPVPTLDEADIRFFRTFGFLVRRGLFADDIATISEGFDEVFAAEVADESYRPVHYEAKRLTISPFFVERSPKLSWIKSDPRLAGVLTSLLGPGYRDDDSDGNIFACDTGWHSDMFGADLQARLYVKVYFYLDPLVREAGALRVIPGTNSLDGYADRVRKALWEVDGPESAFGIDPRDIPSWTIETRPGDVVFGDFRTMHAAFDGGPDRRLFTINFSSPHDIVDQL